MDCLHRGAPHICFMLHVPSACLPPTSEVDAPALEVPALDGVVLSPSWLCIPRRMHARLIVHPARLRASFELDHHVAMTSLITHLLLCAICTPLVYETLISNPCDMRPDQQQRDRRACRWRRECGIVP